MRRLLWPLVLVHTNAENALVNQLRSCHIDRVINQRPNPLNEAHGVRQGCVKVEGRLVGPAGMNVEKPGIPRGAKSINAETVGFLTRGHDNFMQRFGNGILLAFARMKTRKDEQLHPCSLSALCQLCLDAGSAARILTSVPSGRDFPRNSTTPLRTTPLTSGTTEATPPTSVAVTAGAFLAMPRSMARLASRSASRFFSRSTCLISK